MTELTTTVPKTEVALAPDPSEVARIVGVIDITDRASISTYGEGAQRDVTKFADNILAEVKNKEIGNTGTLLIEIIEKSRGLDPTSLNNKGGFIERMFGNAQARVARFTAQFETVADQIDRIAIELDRHKDNLRRDLGILDDLHDKTRESIVRLEAHIVAGKQFVDDFRANHLPGLKGQGESGDILAAQSYQDTLQGLDRLEKRISYLQQALQLGIQQLPQIRIVQSGNETLIENLQATATLTVPAWKQKMVLLLGLSRQKNALEMQAKVTDATNAMLRETSAMMKGQAVAIEEQSQRGIVDIETLEQTNKDLIDTVSQVLAIQAQGRAKRADAEHRMEQMTVELKKALTSA